MGLAFFTDELGITDSEATDRALDAQKQGNTQANALLQQNYNDAQARYQPIADKGNEAFMSLNDMANNYKSFSEAEGKYQGNSGVFSDQKGLYQNNSGVFSDQEGQYKGHDGTFTMKDFKEDPGYAFRMQEGTKQLQRSQAASGSLNSGGAMKAMARYGQGLASQEYGNAYDRFNQDYGNARNNFNQDYTNSYNRFNQDYGNARNNYNNDYSTKFNGLNSIANYGQNANNAITNAGTSSSTNMANNSIGLGNSIANAEMHRNDEIKDLWGQAASAAGTWATGGMSGLGK